MFIDKFGNSWIAISEFHQQAFCEFQLKHKWEGIVKETEKMKIGSNIHEERLRKFLEETEEAKKVRVEDAIKRAIEKGERFSARELLIRSSTFRIYGNIDLIEIGPNGILITDEKPSDYPFISDKVQLLAYAIAFKDRYRPPLDIFIIMKHRDKGDIVWEEILTQDLVDFMLERIDRLHNLALGKRKFEPTLNPKKCLKCAYRDVCERKSI